ncbi:MAG: PAS domain S-box protein [Anaerolineae bacterium]|nr:PAS domain S-box protein [Anaerolineae bacterium]
MHSSIRTRLTLAFISLAISPLLLVGVVLARQSFIMQRRQSLDLQREVARRVATQVMAFFEELENELRLTSQMQGLSKLNRDKQFNVLSELLAYRDIFEELVLLDNRGQEQIHISRRNVVTTLRDRSQAAEFIALQTTDQAYYSPVRFDELTGEPLIIIAVPLSDLRTGQMDGVLVAEIRIKKIWNIIGDVRLSPGQSVYIVNAEGQVVAHRNPSVVLRGVTFPVPDQDGIQPGLASVNPILVEDTHPAPSIKSWVAWLTGPNVVLAVDTVRFGAQEFNIIAEQAVAESLALAVTTILVTAGIIMAALLVSGMLGFVTVRQIVQPIQAMARTAQAISAGDLAQQVQVAGRDEVGVLAAAFNSMTAQLRQSLESLEQQVVEVKQAEESLRQANETLQALIDYSPLAIIMLDLNSHILLWNNAAEKIYGWTAQEVLGKFVPFLTEAQYQDLNALRERVTQGEIFTSLELEGRCKDGSRIWMGVSLAPLRDATESVYAYVSIAADITERKRGEEAVREEQQRTQMILETIVVPVLISRPSDGEILYANPALAQVSRMDPDKFLGDHTVNYFADIADRQTIVELLQRQGAISNFEVQFKRGDGTLYWVLLSSRLIHYQNEICVISSFVDITERKQAETERTRLLVQIQEQAQRMQQIMDTVPEGVLLLDAQGGVILSNPIAARDLVTLAGAQVGDILTHLGDHSLAELLTSPPKGLWHELITGGKVFEAIARPLEVGPAPGGWVLVLRDVTRQREFDRRVQQQEQLAAIGQLAAGIAHDFNNILAVITLYAQMELRSAVPSPKFRERMGIIIDQTQRAAALIQQILDFGRRAVFERRPLDFFPFLKEQIQLLERTLPENIKLSLVHPVERLVIQADPTRLQQVIMNLAVNARDAMPKGGELRFALQSLHFEKDTHAPLVGMQRGSWIQLTVTDTGSGITPENLPHVFEPFFTTKGPLGTGLGLAQVYGIVKQHDGDLDVVSEVGHGTTFSLYFPAMVSLSPELEPPPSEALPQGHEETLLVVEDNPVVRAALVEMLSTLNYRVLEAANGHTALALLGAHAGEIAVVLSDMVMPEMGGQALFHAMRQQGLSIPVVILSGHPVEDDLQGLRSQGLAGWLLKPPDVAQLAQVLQRVLQ